MAHSEYYIGILTIFIGFTFSKYMDSIFTFWVKSKEIKFSYVHAGWVLFVCMVMLDYAWAFFPPIDYYIKKNLFFFLLFMTPVGIWQLYHFYLFPPFEKIGIDSSESSDFKYDIEPWIEKHRGHLYSIGVVFVIVMQGILVLIDELEDDWTYRIPRLSYIAVFSISGFVIKQRLFNNKVIRAVDFFVIVLSLILMSYFLYRDASPNETRLEVTIESNDYRLNTLIRKNCTVQMGGDTTPYPIDLSTGKVNNNKKYAYGDSLRIKVVPNPGQSFKVYQDIDRIKVDYHARVRITVDTVSFPNEE